MNYTTYLISYLFILLWHDSPNSVGQNFRITNAHNYSQNCSKLIKGIVKSITHWVKQPQSICRMLTRLWLVIQVGHTFITSNIKLTPSSSSWVQRRNQILTSHVTVRRNSVFDLQFRGRYRNSLNSNMFFAMEKAVWWCNCDEENVPLECDLGTVTMWRS